MGFLCRFVQGVAATWDVASPYGSCEEKLYSHLYLSSRRLRVQRLAAEKTALKVPLLGTATGVLAIILLRLEKIIYHLLRICLVAYVVRRGDHLFHRKVRFGLILLSGEGFAEEVYQKARYAI